jgi:tetratricopeptide (TPR) repeat protein
LKLCRQINHRHGEGLTLIHLGEACVGLQRYNEALDYLVQALATSRDTGDRHGEALALTTLGLVYEMIDRPDLARLHRQTALLIFDNLGDPQADGLRARLRASTTPEDA